MKTESVDVDSIAYVGNFPPMRSLHECHVRPYIFQPKPIAAAEHSRRFQFDTKFETPSGKIKSPVTILQEKQRTNRDVEFMQPPDQGCEIDANEYAKCRRFDDSLSSHMYESVGSRFLQQKLAEFLERTKGNLDSGGDTCSGYKSVNSYESVGTFCGMLPKLMAQASAKNTLIREELMENDSEYQSSAGADVYETSGEGQ